jgi:cation:H+ antiporter
MPNELILSLLLFLGSIFVLGKSADVLEEKFIHIAKLWKISEFFVGFLILGFATSLPEFSVLLNSLFLQTPTLSLGNLSGGILVIFGLLLPLRAVIGHGLPFKGRFGVRELLFTLIYISLPFLLIALIGPNQTTGVLLVSTYPLLVYLASRRHRQTSQPTEEPRESATTKVPWPKTLVAILTALFFLLTAADLTVSSARQITQELAIPSFLFGLTFLALGTNLPELSLLLTSLHSPARSKVAVGDLLGSAAVNTLFIGVLLSFSPLVNFSPTTFYLTGAMALGLLSLFFLFAWRHHEITPREGVLLLLAYLIFVMSEFVF